MGERQSSSSSDVLSSSMIFIFSSRVSLLTPSLTLCSGPPSKLHFIIDASLNGYLVPPFCTEDSSGAKRLGCERLMALSRGLMVGASGGMGPLPLVYPLMVEDITFHTPPLEPLGCSALDHWVKKVLQVFLSKGLSSPNWQIICNKNGTIYRNHQTHR